MKQLDKQVIDNAKAIYQSMKEKLKKMNEVVSRYEKMLDDTCMSTMLNLTFREDILAMYDLSVSIRVELMNQIHGHELEMIEMGIGFEEEEQAAYPEPVQQLLALYNEKEERRHEVFVEIQESQGELLTMHFSELLEEESVLNEELDVLEKALLHFGVSPTDLYGGIHG